MLKKLPLRRKNQADSTNEQSEIKSENNYENLKTG